MMNMNDDTRSEFEKRLADPNYVIVLLAVQNRYCWFPKARQELVRAVEQAKRECPTDVITESIAGSAIYHYVDVAKAVKSKTRSNPNYSLTIFVLMLVADPELQKSVDSNQVINIAVDFDADGNLLSHMEAGNFTQLNMQMLLKGEDPGCSAYADDFVNRMLDYFSSKTPLISEEDFAEMVAALYGKGRNVIDGKPI